MFWRASHYLSSMFSRPPSPRPPHRITYWWPHLYPLTKQIVQPRSLKTPDIYTVTEGDLTGFFYFVFVRSLAVPSPQTKWFLCSGWSVCVCVCVYKKTFHPAAVVAQIPLIPSSRSNYAALRILNCSIKAWFMKKKKKKKVRAQNPISAGAMRKHAVPAQ